MKSLKRSRGIGMIEVLITLVVIAIGILGHISFQRVVFRDTNVAEGRNNAIELAADKIEDLRRYSRLESTTGQFAYEDIASDTGGNIGQGTVTIGNTIYNRSWNVANWYHTSTNSAPTQTVPAGNPLPDFKQISVIVTWTDVQGDVQSLSLHSAIAASDPALAARIFR